MNDQPAMNDETIEKFRQIRDLSINPYNDPLKSLHEIGNIAFNVLLDHAPEFAEWRAYIEKYGSEPK